MPRTDIVKSDASLVPSESFITCLITVNCGAISSLIMVHVALCPNPNVIEVPEFCIPVHTQELAEYPVGPDSDRVYVPASKDTPLTAPPAPEIVVGPVALNVQFAAVAVPPLLFITFFTSVRDGAISSFVIVHILFSPGSNVIVPFTLQSPLHADARYPV